MQSFNYLKRDLKTLAIVNFATGIIMILSSVIGHYLTPYRLIPSSVVGGTIGVLCGVYLCSKLNLVGKRDIFPVFLSTLIFFGLMAFVAVFNLHSPAIILVGFSLTGLITVISNHYFVNHHNIPVSRIYGTLGLVLAFPALYFVVASILKFQFGQNFLFGFVDNLLSRRNGQANFNSITPFLFGGGLLLAFGLNLFSQIENNNGTKNFSYKSLHLRLKTLNLIVVILTGFIGLAILSYLAVENF